MNKIATNDNLLEELDLKAYKDEVYTKSEVDEAIENGGKVKKVENKEPDASGNVNLGLSTVAFSGKYSDLSGLPDLSGAGSGGNVYELQKVDFTASDWTEVSGKYRLGTSVKDIIDVYAQVGESYQKTFVEVHRDSTATLFSPVAFAGFYQYGTNLTGVTDKNGRDIVDTYATKDSVYNKTETDNRYLKLSGGTLSTTTIGNSNMSYINYCAESDWDAPGAALSLSKGVREDAPFYSGSFSLKAKNESSEKVLTGKPDGTLIWDNNAIALAKDFVSKSGDTINGVLTIGRNAHIRQGNTDASVFLAGGVDWNSGASLDMNGKDRANVGGFAILRGCDGNNAFSLTVSPSTAYLSTSPATADNSTNIATTAFVNNKIDAKKEVTIADYTTDSPAIALRNYYSKMGYPTTHNLIVVTSIYTWYVQGYKHSNDYGIFRCTTYRGDIIYVKIFGGEWAQASPNISYVAF